MHKIGIVVTSVIIGAQIKWDEAYKTSSIQPGAY